MIRATLQLCTYNRATLLERVLAACFEQTAEAAHYEVVLVDDGSSDGTQGAIERMRPKATCSFTVVTQENRGLARARNAGIARARGERIIFIDDDVLPMPNFVEEHLRSHAEHPRAIVRGAVINTASFDDLPPPTYSLRNYSGNFFWTSNVSVPLGELRAAGAFDEGFAEYGWEDIELGLRLRERGLRAVFNRRALAFHFKPPPCGRDVPRLIAQARAQGRTARRLRALHPSWRAALATADTPPQRWLATALHVFGVGRRLAAAAGRPGDAQPLRPLQRFAAQLLAGDAYFDELQRRAT